MEAFSFTSRTTSHRAPLSFDSRTGRISLPPSPPVSPQFRDVKDNIELLQEEAAVQDPQLFDNQEDNKLSTGSPLFPDGHSSDSSDRHSASVEVKSANASIKPTREEYELWGTFVSSCWTDAKKNPKAWIKREAEFMQVYGTAHRVTKPLKIGHLRKLAPAPSNGSKPARKLAAPRIPRAPRVQKRTPKATAAEDFDSCVITSPRAPRAPTNRDDVDYQSLDDFSPPISTLPNGAKSLKADWKGQLLDLSSDPDRHILPEAEYNLAATLRLSCATYLCSKRRIFQARVHCLKIGKEFRKTDAQQACKIDVNKASKLWSAYDRVGWFNTAYFQQYV